MIAGIEGLHAWTPPGASEPAVILGQRTEGAWPSGSGSGSGEDGEAEVWPRFKLIDIGGLDSLGDHEDNKDKRVGGIGTIPRRSMPGEKSVTYQGIIEARTLRELRSGTAALRAAFADRNNEGRMDVRWHPENAEFAGDPPKFYEARALLCEIPDKQVGKRFNRAFVIGLRMGDPRYFDEETEVYEVEISETTTPEEFK